MLQHSFDFWTMAGAIERRIKEGGEERWEKLIRNSAAEFLVFSTQAGDAVSPMGDSGAVGVCDQEVS
ncbi:MAG: hypothetical protein KAU94_07205 [Verrucomicrobia bacterium]|nr:hypothetical protein [Verrucomicrobiota bacterium]